MEVPPKAKIPVVEFPVAEPPLDPAVAAVAELTTHPEYVYLSRVATLVLVNPRAKIPTVLLPAAEPV
jgi:hypothetical protein